MIKLGKYVNNLTRVYCNIKTSQENLLQSNIKWLSIFKKLKKLAISFEYSNEPIENFQFLYNKLLKALKKQRIEVFSSDCTNWDLSSLAFFHKSLTKLQFCIPNAVKYQGQKTNISLYHLQDLKYLEVLHEIQSVHFLKILQSIQKPDQLLCLGVSLQKITSIEDANKLKIALNAFQNIKKFSMEFNQCDFLSGILQSLLNLSLRHLELKGKSTKEEEVQDLVNIASKFTNLKVLKIRIQGIFWIHSFKLPASFFTNLSQITQLEILDLDLSIRLSFELDTPAPREVWLNLGKTILNLSSLKELAFRCLKGDFEPDFKHLNVALSRLAPNLKRLELNFNQEKLDLKDLITFFRLLESMPKLETLALEGFPISKKKFLNWFEEILYKLPYLKSVSLTNSSISRKEDFEFLQKRITMKKGFEIIDIPYSVFRNYSDDDDEFIGERIKSYEEVIKKNPYFRFRTQPSWDF